MEFIAELPDKKMIQKQDIGINPFLIENNIEKIQKITSFFNKWFYGDRKDASC